MPTQAEPKSDLEPIAGDQLAAMIDPKTTALLVVDAQVDFIAPEGPWAKAGFDLSSVPPALEKANRLADVAREAGATVVYIRVITSPDTDSDALKNFYTRRGFPLETIAICRRGTPGADYYGVDPQPGDMHVEKVLFSSFYGTDFEERLRERGIDTLVVTGFTTDCCVDSTVRDAFHRGFNVFLVGDACAASPPSRHETSLIAILKNTALLTQTDDVLAAWS